MRLLQSIIATLEFLPIRSGTHSIFERVMVVSKNKLHFSRTNEGNKIAGFLCALPRKKIRVTREKLYSKETEWKITGNQGGWVAKTLGQTKR